MALTFKMLNVMSHADPYLHVHHPRCLLCMSADVILAGWQETFRFTASRLAADLKVSCQPAGRRHFQKKYNPNVHPKKKTKKAMHFKGFLSLIIGVKSKSTQFFYCNMFWKSCIHSSDGKQIHYINVNWK